MAASLSSLNDVLKESYVIDMITDQLNNDTRLWQDFDSATLNWTGKECIMPLRVGRNSGIGAVAENGTLPTAGQQTYAKLSITAKGVYGTGRGAVLVVDPRSGDVSALVADAAFVSPLAVRRVRP